MVQQGSFLSGIYSSTFIGAGMPGGALWFSLCGAGEVFRPIDPPGYSITPDLSSSHERLLPIGMGEFNILTFSGLDVINDINHYYALQ